ncbi:MAG: signal peptidase I [Desulfosporosinus sp.]|jgi:signal peptidase
MYAGNPGFRPEKIEGWDKLALNGKRILVNCVKYGLFIFLSLVILINFYLGINKAVTHNPVPKFLGIAPLVVMSGSMEPAIMPGDVVVIREQPSSRYQIGDVVTYSSGAIIYTHRIVGEENGVFILKGDSNNVADDTVAPGQLLGKVLFRIPKIGVAVLFFKTPLGIAVLLILLVLCLYGEEIYQRIRRPVN